MPSNAEMLSKVLHDRIKNTRRRMQECQEEYFRLANLQDTLVLQATCKHNNTSTHGSECITIECKDCGVEVTLDY